MITVLRHGNGGLTKRLYLFECNDCGCLFTATGTDCTVRSDVHNAVIMECNCPECRRRVYTDLEVCS